MVDLPLKGISVVDLSNLLAGPMVSMYLGDFGADVVKVEDPRSGDEMRNWGMSKDGEPLFFKVVNRNKRLIGLNLRDPRGQEIARELIETADVVVESFRPGTLERWGLGYEELSKVNPGLVMARISGYGQTGPYASRPGFGTIAEAFSGFAWCNGYPELPPLLPSFGLGDATTSVCAALGVMLALYQRDAGGGRGQVVDLALYESLLTLLGSHVIDFDQLGVIQTRTGGSLPFVAPRNIYQTADDAWVAISAGTQSTFDRLLDALGRGDLKSDPRFSDHLARRENSEEMDRILQESIGKMALTDALEALDDIGAPVGPAYRVDQLMVDAQVEARENIISIQDSELGPVQMQGVVPRLTATPGRVTSLPGALGRDTASVLVERTLVSEADLAELTDAEVI